MRHAPLHERRLLTRRFSPRSARTASWEVRSSRTGRYGTSAGSGEAGEAFLHGPCCNLRARAEAELREHVPDVRLDRALAKHEMFGDVAVRHAARNERRDFSLAGGQPAK